ncbi:hypothetical protein [Flagellimonas sp.]|uniref:hypothetical protein n=1 Tax=Flagellimonas sp. TaxID=2058762 RepID=UPI003BABD192
MISKIRYTSYRTTKSKLFSLIRPFDYRVFTDIINPIISENRGMDLGNAKWIIKLQSVEVIEFLNQTGIFVEDIGKDIEISEGQISKKQLKELIPEITNNEIEKELNPILEKRQFTFSEQKWVRYINLEELRTFLEQIGEPFEIPESKIVELV